MYHEMPIQDEDDPDADDVAAPLRGRLAGFGIGQSGKGILRKAGLNEYEKAMWRWVNVEDLDAFLQEVSTCNREQGQRADNCSRSTTTTKARAYIA